MSLKQTTKEPVKSMCIQFYLIEKIGNYLSLRLMSYFIFKYSFNALVTVSDNFNFFSCILFVTSSHNS